MKTKHSLVLLPCVVLAAAVALAAGRAPSPTPSLEGEVDIDLSKSKGPIVYSQLFDMTRNPRGYVGKTVRMKGAYTSFYDGESKTRYHACLVSDAMACCAQGIEFAPTNSLSWPGDFPSEGGAILVQGVFETCEENGAAFVRLRDAEVAFSK